jgi:predicted amidohydrolase
VSEAFRLAVAQSVVGLDPTANGASVRSLLVTAHEQGARMIQFPEGALSGYTAGQAPSGWRTDWATVRTELEATAKLAGQLGI